MRKREFIETIITVKKKVKSNCRVTFPLSHLTSNMLLSYNLYFFSPYKLVVVNILDITRYIKCPFACDEHAAQNFYVYSLYNISYYRRAAKCEKGLYLRFILGGSHTHLQHTSFESLYSLV